MTPLPPFDSFERVLVLSVESGNLASMGMARNRECRLRAIPIIYSRFMWGLGHRKMLV